MVAILNTDILAEIRMSVDEYLVADFPEGYRYELVEGVVYVAPPPEIPHDSVVDFLHFLFSRYRTARSDLVSHVTQRAAVIRPGRQTAREPDLAVYGPSQMGNKHGKSWKHVRPTLVVEVVSEGQEDRDYDEKRRDYWEAGIPEYWIADREREALTVLTRGMDTWNEQIFGKLDAYQPALFPGLEVRIAELFE